MIELHPLRRQAILFLAGAMIVAALASCEKGKNNQPSSQKTSEMVQPPRPIENKKVITEKPITGAMLANLKTLFDESNDFNIGDLSKAKMLVDQDSTKTMKLEFSVRMNLYDIYADAFPRMYLTHVTSAKDALVHNCYIRLFQKGKTLFKKDPHLKYIIVEASEQVSVRDKFGNETAQDKRVIFTCCQCREMAENLNVEYAINVLASQGTAAASNYLECK